MSTLDLFSQDLSNWVGGNFDEADHLWALQVARDNPRPYDLARALKDHFEGAAMDLYEIADKPESTLFLEWILSALECINWNQEAISLLATLQETDGEE